MPKYKYVDGVKYRVVPQSVLGYALVREDSDNSLPAGGTEGQVLTKASNTDYDVEWSTVESGEEQIYTVTGSYSRDESTAALSVSITNNIEDVIAAVRGGKYLTARIAPAEAGSSDTLYLSVHSIYDFEGSFAIKFVSPFTEMDYVTGYLSCTDSYMLVYDGSDWYLSHIANEVPLS